MTLSFLRRLSAASLMTVALAGPALGHSLAPLAQSRDYRFPSPSDLRERVMPLPVSGAKAFGSGERVSYVGFDGKTYELNRFQGRYVEILLPDAWLGAQALSEAQVQHFVDRTDMIYQYFLDLLGTPPSGDGLLPIAVLPTVCGGALGCSWVGMKGVEMADEVEARSSYWQEIAAGIPLGVLVHELTHNFDVFSSYLTYVADGSHGWTTFLTNYYFPFSHEGWEGTSPEDITQEALDYTSYYFQDPTATWASCVRDDQCEDRYIYPENTYGGFGLRIALRYGPRTVTGFSAFLRQYVQSHQPPETAEEKNDLYVEALAAGAHLNLSCVADAWRWPISDALRQRMKQLYGPRNPDCEDQDHDGYTPLQGDCDDHRASIHPGALDRPNGLDYGCDGRIGETVYQDVGGTSFTAPRVLSLPAEASGAASGDLSDFYQIHLKSPARIQIEFCNPSTVYGQVAVNRSTTFLGAVGVEGPGCLHGTFSLDAGDWNLTASLASPTPLDYTMAVQQTTPWPVPPWARTAPPQAKGRQWVLRAPTAIPHLPAAPTAVRFWVSGQGYVGTVRYSRNASFAWTPPAGVDPVADGVTYRAQVLADGVPIYEITVPQAFAAP